jgi:hypothetical protein
MTQKVTGPLSRFADEPEDVAGELEQPETPTARVAAAMAATVMVLILDIELSLSSGSVGKLGLARCQQGCGGPFCASQ